MWVPTPSVLWLDEDDALQRGIDELREGVQAVSEKQRLEPDWFNETAAGVPSPFEGTWRNAAVLVWGLG
jgi:hypothetical protein